MTSKKLNGTGSRGAILYARVSTLEQAATNNSIPLQESKFNDYCAFHDLHPLATFVDRESARTADKRPQFQKMLRYCKEHHQKIACVIVADLSRFARNVTDQGISIAMLAKLGIKTVSIAEPLVDTTAIGRLAGGMVGVFNQYFSDALSENTRVRMAAGVKSGRWLWKAPLGYLNEVGTKRVIPDPQRAGLIRKAFELAAEDFASSYTLVTAMGLKTRGSKPLPRQTFSRMLRNEFYCGWIESGDVRVKGSHEPLITEELFYRVQQTVAGNKNAGNIHQDEREDFPLRKFVRCGTCDKPLTAGWVKGKMGKRYPFYWCWRGCKLSVSKERLEESFGILLEQVQPTAEILARLPTIAARTWALRKEQISEDSRILTRRLQDQKDMNLKAIRAKLDGDLSTEDFNMLKESITAESGRIQGAMIELDQEQSNYAALMNEAEREVMNFSDAWKNGTLRRKQELQNALFSEGLQYRKSRVFELQNGFSNEELTSVFSALLSDGVPDGI